MHQAVFWNKIDVLRVLLEHDRSLGYVVKSDNGTPLLNCAAYQGHVMVARELLKHCPDTPYSRRNGWTCLHQAVLSEKTEFVEFVLGLPQLRKLVNMPNSNGDTALHLAVERCNPTMVAALLLHQDIDVTVLNNINQAATWKLSGAYTNAKTLNWVRIFLSTLLAYTTQTSTNKKIKLIIMKGSTAGFLNCLKSTVTINFLGSKDTSDY